MRFKEFRKYLGFFIVAAALIIVYKTFDNFGVIIDAITKFVGLFTPFIAGAIIAFLLHRPCRRVEIILRRTKFEFLRKHRCGLAVLIVYIIALAAIVLIMKAIIPQLVNSLSKFIEQLPNMINSLVDWINSFGVYKIEDMSVQKILSSELFSLNNILKGVNIQNMNKYAQSVINVGSSVVDIILGVVISVYMLIERRGIKRAFLKFAKCYLPEKFTNATRTYGKKIAGFITRYISCQLLDALVVFILALIVLSIMRTEYAALIALMLGSFNLIPYFGAFLAILISALIVFVTDGFMSAIIVIVVLTVLQQVDANIIQPRLVATSLSIKPLLVILGVVVGGGLFGIAGIFLAVPLLALLQEIVGEMMDKKLSKTDEIVAEPIE